jgi:hypothetical protein
MAKEIQNTKRSLRAHAIGMIGILTLQFLIGMYVTFFVSFPEDAQREELWKFAMRQPFIALHILLGLLLLLGTIALLVRGIVLKNAAWIKSATIALLATIGAIVAGIVVVPSQNDLYSFLMAVGFIIALLAYFWGIYLDK